jgi:murein DD-endopeptidase MepM/ murein hydrolase activator NlpD
MQQPVAKFLFAVFAAAIAVLLLNQSSYLLAQKAALRARLSVAVEKIILPYHLSRLATEEPDTELAVPIEGLALRYIPKSWGDPRSGGRLHEGIDMFAKRGEPVFSATYGYVIYAGTNQLGGNVVFVFGAGGVRYYYAHLDSIAEGIVFGKEVSTSTVLGYVGKTGNAEFTSPHLHFGMYKDGAKNPYDLLVPRTR